MARMLYVGIELNVLSYDEALEELEAQMRDADYDYYISNDPYYPEQVVLLVNQAHVDGRSDNIEDLLNELDIDYNFVN